MTPVYEGEKWPPRMPERSYFEKTWEADPVNQKLQSRDEYLGWVLQFYEGKALVPGWWIHTRNIISDLPVEHVQKVDPLFAYLGQLIASEWAKHNDHARIESKNMIAWVGAMNKARRNRKPVEPLLLQIQNDVHGLIAGSLPKAEVTRKRYRKFTGEKRN